MTLTRSLGLPAAIALAAFSAAPAQAQDAFWYGGLGAGASMANIDDARITGGLAAKGFATTSLSDDERDIGYKLYGGRRFGPNFALEGGFFDLGKFGYRATTVPAGTLNGSMRVRGLNLDAVGFLPLSERLSVLGRVGTIYANTRDSFSGTGAVVVLDPSPSRSALNVKVGVGLQFDVTPAFGLRLEAERYRIDDAVGNTGHVDLFTLGLVYRMK